MHRLSFCQKKNEFRLPSNDLQITLFSDVHSGPRRQFQCCSVETSDSHPVFTLRLSSEGVCAPWAFTLIHSCVLGVLTGKFVGESWPELVQGMGLVCEETVFSVWGHSDGMIPWRGYVCEVKFSQKKNANLFASRGGWTFRLYWCWLKFLLTFCLLVVFRYIAICHPIKAQTICTVRRAMRIIAGLWIFGICYCMPWLFLTKTTSVMYANGVTIERCGFKLPRNQYVSIYMADLIIFYLFPLVLNCLLYGLIARILFSSAIPSTPGKANGASSQVNRKSSSRVQVSSFCLWWIISLLSCLPRGSFHTSTSFGIFFMMTQHFFKNWERPLVKILCTEHRIVHQKKKFQRGRMRFSSGKSQSCSGDRQLQKESHRVSERGVPVHSAAISLGMKSIWPQTGEFNKVFVEYIYSATFSTFPWQRNSGIEKRSNNKGGQAWEVFPSLFYRPQNDRALGIDSWRHRSDGFSAQLETKMIRRTFLYPWWSESFSHVVIASRWQRPWRAAC